VALAKELVLGELFAIDFVAASIAEKKNGTIKLSVTFDLLNSRYNIS